MNDYKMFNSNYNWYRGNLHCHSIFSDGKLKPKDIVTFYKQKGYSFLAFTDHDLFTDWSEFNTPDFIILPAAEREVVSPNPWKRFHIQAIQGSNNLIKDAERLPYEHQQKFSIPSWEGNKTVQVLINDINQSGNIAILNHPEWSRLELKDFDELDGYVAMEIFNYSSKINYTDNGSVTLYWDSLLRKGKKVLGVATDDNHNRYPYDSAYNDSAGGWIMVNAPELTHDNIIEAILEGRFYSSAGPEIYNIRIEHGEVIVECSPVCAVYFVTYESWSESVREVDNTLTKASYRLKGFETFIRIECETLDGKKAWSNPIFLEHYEDKVRLFNLANSN